MSWSEIKKKKEEEEKKYKSAKTSNSGISTVKNIIVGDLWKNVGQNIITSQKKAEERKSKEAETKKSTTKANNNNQFRVSQNVMPMSTSGSTYQRTIQPSIIKTTPVKVISQKEIDKARESATTWQKINDFINNSVSNVQSFENKVYDNVGNVMDKATDKTIDLFRGIGKFANNFPQDFERFDQNLGEGIMNGIRDIATKTRKARVDEQIQREKILYSPYETLANSKNENTRELAKAGLKDKEERLNYLQSKKDLLDTENIEKMNKSQKLIEENISNQSNAFSKKLAELAPSARKYDDGFCSKYSKSCFTALHILLVLLQKVIIEMHLLEVCQKNRLVYMGTF